MSGSFDAWVGRSEPAPDTITLRQARQMAATLGDTCAGDVLEQDAVLPPLWHQMGRTPDTAMAGLGPDGHPAKAGFLPPVPLERRMWAGGRPGFHTALRIGAPMQRRSEILKVSEKTGRAGNMVFRRTQPLCTATEDSLTCMQADVTWQANP